MSRKEELNKLIEDINNFDLFYEMSDSSRTRDEGTELDNSIKRRLKLLNRSETNNVINKLSTNGKEAVRLYFQGSLTKT